MRAVTAYGLDRAFLQRLADWLAVGVALALPWSTSAASIFIIAWLLAVLAALDRAAVWRALQTPAGGLPVLLWCLGLLGMAWADVSWKERLGGLDSFHRLLIIPLLFAQFRRSENGRWVVAGFFISELLVLLTSYILVLTPGLAWRGHVDGVPVHDDVFQGSAFLVCAFGALGYAAHQRQQRWRSFALIAAAALFIGNFAFVTISRSALLVAPVLAILLGWRLARWKGVLTAAAAMAAIGTAFWLLSPILQQRLHDSFQEMQDYRVRGEATSLGMHTAFLKESLAIIASAPIVGHGTGAITEQFRRVTAGRSGADAVAPDNPHNQTFAVAIQIGVIGALILWAMWIAHFTLFHGKGAAAWAGTALVAENIVSSLAHSHLFDFTNGWLYVFGVGVLGGMVLREETTPERARQGLP
jgi:O-antigen ligase